MRNFFASGNDIHSIKKSGKYSVGLFIFIAVFFVCVLLAVELYRIDPPETAVGDKDGYVCDTDFSFRQRKSIASSEKRKAAAEEISADKFSSESEKNMEEAEYSGFVMQNGASIRLNVVTGIRFRARIPADLVEKVKAAENKSFGFVIAPAYYFEKAAELAGAADVVCDYVPALAELEFYGAKPALQLVCEPVQEEGEWIIQASVANILYANTNLAYTAAAYVKTGTEADGFSYFYAGYETDCLGISRSVSYVATAALNDTSSEYSPEQKTLLKQFIFRSMDLAAGLREGVSEEKGGKITLSFSAVPDGSLSPEESFAFSAEAVAVYSDGSYISLQSPPLYWTSSDSAVAVVSSTGTVTVFSEGRSVITVFFGETALSAEVICSVEKLFVCELAAADGFEDLLEIVSEKQEIAGGKLFETDVRVRQYENYGELSFWINGTLYTTEEGVAHFSAEITGSAVFRVEKLSSSLSYFTIGTNSLYIKNEAAFRQNLPEKLILPSVGKDGTILTKINTYTFNNQAGNIVCVNLREITIPESYKNAPADMFKNCSALETIYLRNTALATAEVSGTANWDGCTSLKNIYLPEEAFDAYATNKFWKQKKDLFVAYAL